MVKSEMETNKTSNAALPQLVCRKLITTLLRHTFLRYDTIGNYDSLAKAEKFSAEGHPVIILYNHYSYGDPPRAVELVSHEKAIGNKKFISPIADHVYNSSYGLLGKLTGITFEPIVTKNSKKKDNNTIANGGKKKYLEKTTNGLKNGEVIFVAPQQERSSSLGQPKQAVRAIMSITEKEDLENCAFLIIGFGIKGITDYSIKKIKGLNLSKKYIANIGPLLTGKEILTMAIKKAETAGRQKQPLKFVDEVIFEELRKVVPSEYK
jgi:hypothetical protein